MENQVPPRERDVEDIIKDEEKVREDYKKVKDSRVITKEIITPKGETKVKFIRKITFENGVVKNKLIGLSKDGKMMWGVKE